MSAVVTCRSEGCPNEGVPIELGLASSDPVTGEPIEVFDVLCGGGCGQPITDIDSEG